VTTEEIRDWLVSKIAELTGIEPREISVEEPFAAVGLTSSDAVVLSGELEELLGRRLSPALLYDYPSIHILARRLAKQPEDADPLRQSGPETTEEADPLGDILSMLETLSEDEVEVLLETPAFAQKPRGEELK
jgi:acyl carrier protein